MNDRRVDELLSELKTALDVEPSSGFAAGVRERVAHASGRQRPSWLVWVGMGLAAAAVVIVATVWSTRGAGTPAPVVATVANSAAPVVAAPSTVDRASQPVTEPTTTNTGAKIVRRERAAAKPEVLVSRDEADGIRALVSGLNDGTIDPASLATPPPDASVPLEMPAIVIAPIVVAPLDGRAPGTSGGGIAGDIR